MSSLPILVPIYPDQDIDLIRHSISGNLSRVKSILSTDCDINIVESNGVSALIAASAAGHFEVVKLLVSNGADLKLKDELGYDAYHTAMFFGDLKGMTIEPFNKIMSVVKYI